MAPYDPWRFEFGSRGRGGTVPPDQMRVSDAERGEIADALSRHFADGRLDQAEFDERMGRAMAAKTRADLGGLLVDLPPLATTAAVPQQPQRRRRSGALMLVLVAALVFFSAGWWLWPPHVPVFLLLVGFFVLLRHWSWHGRRQHGHWW